MKKLSDILASQSKMHSSEALLLFTPLAKGTVLENIDQQQYICESLLKYQLKLMNAGIGKDVEGWREVI